MNEFNSKFARAKKEKTLEIMVEKQVREMGLRFDPHLNNYRMQAELYRGLNDKAAVMFDAAAQREREIKAPPVAIDVMHDQLAAMLNA